MPARTKKVRPPALSPTPETRSADPRVAAADIPATSPAAEERAHLGDWIALYLWIGCFLLMFAMNWYDLLRALINW